MVSFSPIRPTVPTFGKLDITPHGSANGQPHEKSVTLKLEQNRNVPELDANIVYIGGDGDAIITLGQSGIIGALSQNLQLDEATLRTGLSTVVDWGDIQTGSLLRRKFPPFSDFAGLTTQELYAAFLNTLQDAIKTNFYREESNDQFRVLTLYPRKSDGGPEIVPPEPPKRSILSGLFGRR